MKFDTEVRYRLGERELEIYHASIWHLTGCSRIGQEGLECCALEGRERVGKALVL